jgi:hypothetical protein
MQPNTRKRVVSSCIPCYTRKQKVRYSMAVSYVQPEAHWLACIFSVTVAILAITVRAVGALKSAHTTPRRYCELILRHQGARRWRTMATKTRSSRLMITSCNVLITATLMSPLCRTGTAQGVAIPRSATLTTHLPSYLGISSTANPTLWPLFAR